MKPSKLNLAELAVTSLETAPARVLGPLVSRTEDTHCFHCPIVIATELCIVGNV